MAQKVFLFEKIIKLAFWLYKHFFLWVEISLLGIYKQVESIKTFFFDSKIGFFDLKKLLFWGVSIWNVLFGQKNWGVLGLEVSLYGKVFFK